jgi:ElaB/YqjD/DUF883 family membrane-anchored ribosome-binding protein
MFGNNKTSVSPNSSLDHAGNSAIKALADADTVVDSALQSAEHAMQATQDLAQQALDSLGSGVQELRDKTFPMLHKAADSASNFAHRSVDAVHHQSVRLRDQASLARANTSHYIREEPVKSVLMAAATGAALMALIGMFSRRRG